MRATNMKNTILQTRLLAAMVAVALMLTASAFAAAPGIKGPTFNLTAQEAYISQPDGAMIYSWGYGCSSAPTGFLPQAMANATCPSMQIPGPTLIVNEGDSVSVTLTNNLPASAGNTSILFPGFTLTSTCPAGQQGLLTCEAAPAGTVTYTFTATTPGTRAYYSGTQGDLQVEMGLYGAIIVVPTAVPAACTSGLHATNLTAEGHWGETDFRLAAAAYDNASTCYDREYMFQFSEIDPRIHTQADAQVHDAARKCVLCSRTCDQGCSLEVLTEPYHPAYFMINGRSMPDDMDPNYTPQYPHQPYNGNPHMHPGEQLLLRIIGQGRWQHPFHEHGNHVRILARDGNLILTPDGKALAGPAMFTTTTTPGLAMDGIFYWTGRGLNWDAYGHRPQFSDPNAKLTCTRGCQRLQHWIRGVRYYFFRHACRHHRAGYQLLRMVSGSQQALAGRSLRRCRHRAVRSHLPDATILTNGAWYGGSPYLGPDATARATGCTPSDALLTRWGYDEFELR